MARRPTCWKKSVKLQVEKLERKCRYCKTHQSARGFDKHQAWCKKTWIIRQEYRLHNHSITNQLQPEATDPNFPAVPTSSIEFDTNDEFIEGSSSMPLYPLESPSPELDHPVPTTTSGLSGMLNIILKHFFSTLLRTFQTPLLCLDHIYCRNTLKLFPIPILRIQL